MKFQFVEKRVDVSDALQEYAQKKIGKLDKYFKKEAEAQVVFSNQGNRYILEVTVNNDGMYYRAKEIAEDVYAAVDKSVSSMERQIHKHKTRLEKRLRQGAFEREVSAQEINIPEEAEYSIIRKKTFSLKPMTPEEAILQMNMLHHKFFVFRNFSNGGKFSVVYLRDNGGYGMIEDGE